MREKQIKEMAKVIANKTALSIIEATGIAEILTAEDYCKQREGEWMKVGDYGVSKVVKCSCCEKEFYFMKKGQLNIDKMPNCPKCGAKMRGKQ